jgi:hypothetical protein
LKALQGLSDELGRRSAEGELCLVDDTVMVLAFAARDGTRDMEALFQPAQVLHEAAQAVAATQALPSDWLTGAGKGFGSSRHATTPLGLPQFPNLRLLMPMPEYLLAIKCMTSRAGAVEAHPEELSDIAFLIRHLKLKSAREVMDIVGSYYPANRAPVKARTLVEGLFAEGRI